ncbi:DUF1080 domain-containing protein [Geobacter sp. FeAm09]|uniref:family 16 glycoside hydrolase n=1 Tax=Geobacter sp. FeAm09 TaxID=2597769 RepID=UPI0011EDF8C6|nr:family 16 glycoside hydrolase [Geobacter sp. FeAm09]QEM67754.1 DUF1080 domain-containing protein [Geobacter sp. FeAm09]
MKKTFVCIATLFLLAAGIACAAGIRKYSFDNETFGAESRAFVSLVGTWRIDRNGTRQVYAVDGRKWEQGLMSSGAAEKARTLYGNRSAEFLRNLEAYKYFPLAILKDVPEFRNGTISVSFMGLGGRIDQAAGIAFNIRPNGEYLVMRANALENNLVLFKMEHGKRSSEQWMRNVPTPANAWHTMKVTINGKRIEGFINGTKLIDYTWKEEINGRIGLWSKADSYVVFDNFEVQAR